MKTYVETIERVIGVELDVRVASINTPISTRCRQEMPCAGSRYSTAKLCSPGSISVRVSAAGKSFEVELSALSIDPELFHATLLADAGEDPPPQWELVLRRKGATS